MRTSSLRPALLAILPICLVAATATPVIAAGHGPARPPAWTATWAAAPHAPVPGNDFDGPNWSVPGFTDTTIRQVVRSSAGGSQVRIRLSNAYGVRPVRLAGASIARSGPGASVRPGTARTVRFGRDTEATVPAGGSLASDPVDLRVSPLESLTVTLYFAEFTGPATFHQDGLTTTYRAAGDHRDDAGAAAFAGETSRSRYFLTGVDVAGEPGARGVVVAFGDSITDGHGTRADADNRYPDQLAERSATGKRPVAVVNAGIGGNKLLADSPCYGDRATARFGRDALDQPGVGAVVVLEGVNDIGAGGYPDFGCGASPTARTADLVRAHRTLIRAAHQRGIRIIGATVTPMKNFTGYYDPDKERVRDELNRWIRTGGEYDAVVDLDRLLADPHDPDALRAEFDFGDGLHLNDAGADAIAAAVFRVLARAA
ncbi:SGNH/GDSL hydrolase family protein [Paractinoplanes globisporus]|uniref:SGNH/GDSL hydrolase family protein n=1 Tax=Paractinoplanes globisporus TaxID=113565 RepID=A0ABW6WXW0_9ACTN|nr:SGNH/GDSL hydrolase family protein [Actinoplanes globisporus]